MVAREALKATQQISPRAQRADDDVMNKIVWKCVRYLETKTTLLINLGYVYAHIISCRCI